MAITENKKKTKLSVIELFERRRALRAQIDNLQAEADSLTELLKQAIPENGAKDGVAHAVVFKQTTSYSDYATWLLDKFVPSNKKAAASADKAKFLKPVETHTIKEAKGV